MKNKGSALAWIIIIIAIIVIAGGIYFFAERPKPPVITSISQSFVNDRHHSAHITMSTYMSLISTLMTMTCIWSALLLERESLFLPLIHRLVRLQAVVNFP